MGNPLAPIIANIFMCNLEKIIFQNEKPNFKPVFYRRYVDDTFAVFTKKDDAKLFLNYLNNLNLNITFTKEMEENNQIHLFTL